MKTTYFVSGYMRSGTSMMMQALEAGGLKAAKNPMRDKYLEQRYGKEGFEPNAGGYYELTMRQYTELGFPHRFEGQVIKLLWGLIPQITAGDYRVVFMHRDYAEIAESIDAAFGEHPTLSEDEYYMRMENVEGILRVRSDMDVIAMQYRDVVADPLATFTTLMDRGWPIDPEAAAQIVDPAKHRFQLQGAK